MRTILAIFLLSSFELFSQTKEIRTDSSNIEVNTYADLGVTRTFNELTNNSGITYYTEQDLESQIVLEKGRFLKGDCIGVWEMFDAEGHQIKKISYDDIGGSLTNDPTLISLIQVFESANSILKKSLGDNFFNNHIRLNASRSYKYCENEAENFLDEIGCEPSEYILRYWVKLSDKLRYTTFELKMNNEGEVLSTNQKIGVNGSAKDKLTLTPEQIESIAISNGFDIHKIETSLIFENGDFDFMIQQFVKSTDHGGYGEEFYDVLHVNPWDGTLRKKEQITIEWIE